MNHLHILIVKVPYLATGWRPSIFFFMLTHLLELEESVEVKWFCICYNVYGVLNVLICPFLCVSFSYLSSDLTFICHIRLKNMNLCNTSHYCHFMHVEKPYKVIFPSTWLLCIFCWHMCCIYWELYGILLRREYPVHCVIYILLANTNVFCMLLRSGERGWRQHC